MAQAISKMETTQTAVEWLVEQLTVIYPRIEEMKLLTDKAKHMEKEQIEKAKSDGYHEAMSEAIKEIHKNYQPI